MSDTKQVIASSNNKQKKNFDWLKYYNDTMKLDAENRKEGVQDGLYKIKDLIRNISWDYPLPTLVTDKNITVVLSREAFIRDFYIKYPYLFEFDKTMREKY